MCVAHGVALGAVAGWISLRVWDDSRRMEDNEHDLSCVTNIWGSCMLTITMKDLSNNDMLKFKDGNWILSVRMPTNGNLLKHSPVYQFPEPILW